MRRMTRGAMGLIGLGFLLAGCAMRLHGVEHYVGPVVFRYSDPDAGSSYVSQVARIGVFIEGGTQWGVALGYAERVAVAPRRVEGTGTEEQAVPRWVRPFSLVRPPEPGRWNLSLLYLRVAPAATPLFVRREAFGLEATAGPEAVALSIGVAIRTWSEVPDNAMVRLHFDASRPLQTRLRVWAGPVDAEPPLNFTEEED